MLRIGAVLFDFAGTLLMPVDERAWVVAAAASLGLDLPDGELAELAAGYLEAGLPGGPYPDSVPEALAERYAGRDLSARAHRDAYVGLLRTVATEHEGLAEAVYERVARPDNWMPYADAAEVVGALEGAGVRVGLISNAGFDPRPILREHGFASLAERTTVSLEHGAIKPDPALFRIALDALGAEPRETLMVGDNPEADGGATRLGIRTLLLPMSPPGARHGLEAVARLVL